MELFEKELRTLINLHSKEEDSGTPDFILAGYLNSCLVAYNVAVTRRDFNEGRFITQPDGPKDYTDEQLLMCMPAELRTKTHPPFLTQDMIEDMPPGRIETLPVPEAMLLRPIYWVEGHEPECLIDLDLNWHPCTCGRG